MKLNTTNMHSKAHTISKYKKVSSTSMQLGSDNAHKNISGHVKEEKENALGGYRYWGRLYTRISIEGY